MGYGTINVRLRPIKLAFLVNPNDKRSLLEAIEINTFLWGGIYNPIIPTYKRIPPGWEYGPFKNRNLNARSIISGYLDNFDPDFVVPMGECSDYSFDAGHREKIQDVPEILEPVEEDGTPKYGIGLFEVLNYFIDRELKFQRRHPLEISIPRFGTHFRPFLASVFGILPENIDNIFWGNFEGVLEAKKSDCVAANYAEFLYSRKLFLSRMIGLYLDSIPSRPRWGQYIFFLDATKPLDIMDYWNLRAIGWDVIPVPKQFARFDKTKQLILDFIEANYVPHHSNPEIYHSTTILKSRSISEDEHKHFVASLDISPTDENHRRPKVSLQFWYPRIWDEWARNPDNVECCSLEADTVEHDISTKQETIRFKTLDPKFISHFGGHGEARFANEIVLRLYSHTQLFAEVIPEGGWELARVIGEFDLFNWRLSRKCLVYLSRNTRRTVDLSMPEADALVTKWLELRGWRVDLSPAGRIAKQMIRQLGGKYSIGILARKEIILLLGEMNSGHEKSMLEKTLRAKIHKTANPTANTGMAARILQTLTESKVLQLGVEIQCPICTQSSWYSVKDADYKLQCPKCLEKISFPFESNKVKWSYRTLGPFSSSNQAHGAYTVLLTLRLFSNTRLLGGAVTPLMSFTAKNEKMEIEADLALFFQASKFGASNTEVIFAECKTFNEIQKKDADRMAKLGDAFPGSVLAFATLNNSLSVKEKAFLRTLADRFRKRRKNQRAFNHVLVLTGTELFLESYWDSHLERYTRTSDLHELCDLTQQINLGMDSWDQWLDKQYGHISSAIPTTWISHDGTIDHDQN